jgi:hypothetical protein
MSDAYKKENTNIGRETSHLAADKFKEAELLLRIYEIYSSDSMVDAFTWFFKDFKAENLDDFEKQYPLGGEERKRFYRIGNFFDLLGTFEERNYLPKELVLDFCPDDVKSFWKVTRIIILQMRKKWNDPRLYAGLEHLNERINRWQKGPKNRKK